MLGTKYYYIRAFAVVIIHATLFLSTWTIKYFFITVILSVDCKEIESKL